VAPGIAGGDGEREALAIYGQRGDGFVERERWRIQIASLLEGLFVVFFHF
jgi:putative heme degradation protein